MTKTRRRVSALSAAAVLLLSLVVTAPATAGSAPFLTRSGPLVGAGTGPFYADGTTHEHFSSPAVGDLGLGGIDVVAGYPDGSVRISELTARGLGRTLQVIKVSTAAIQASPVIVDLNKDGHPDVLVADLGNLVEAFTPSQHDRVIFRATTGPRVGHAYGNFATPAVADLNRDGTLDVIESSWSQYVYAWSSKAVGGRFPALRGFPVHLQDTSWSSPAVADVDRDGWPEIVVGYDCDGAKGQRCYPNYGGYVTVLRHDGSVERGWPRLVPHQVVWSSPAVVDLNGDGRLDVVIGTGNMPSSMISGKPMDGGHVLLAFDAATGQPLRGFPAHVSANVTSSPAVGQLTGGGSRQVAVMTEDGYATVVDAAGRVLARACANDALSGCGRAAFHQSFAIGDVTGCGCQELVVGGEQWLDIFRLRRAANATGWTLALVARGWPGDVNFGQVTVHQFTAAPTIATVGGRTWVVLSSDANARTGSGTVTALYAFTAGVLSKSGPDWPTFKHDTIRSGHA